MTVYSVIKRIALEKGDSIASIEKNLDLSNGIISKWDKSMPRADSLQMVADYLGVTSAYILNMARKKD